MSVQHRHVGSSRSDKSIGVPGIRVPEIVVSCHMGSVNQRATRAPTNEPSLQLLPQLCVPGKLHQPGLHCLHPSLFSYCLSSHRTAHWVLSARGIFQPSVPMFSASSPNNGLLHNGPLSFCSPSLSVCLCSILWQSPCPSPLEKDRVYFNSQVITHCADRQQELKKGDRSRSHGEKLLVALFACGFPNCLLKYSLGLLV